MVSVSEVWALMQPNYSRVQELKLVKSVKAKIPPVAMVWKFEKGFLALMSSASFEQDSKLRGLSPIALVLRYITMLKQAK
ncbi:hypothetical protein TNCV_3886561 [Trichonephila clavipes]|nr:hypothetical protein TNCV_3886561 [Trichonephila clavipes]